MWAACDANNKLLACHTCYLFVKCWNLHYGLCQKITFAPILWNNNCIYTFGIESVFYLLNTYYLQNLNDKSYLTRYIFLIYSLSISLSSVWSNRSLKRCVSSCWSISLCCCCCLAICLRCLGLWPMLIVAVVLGAFAESIEFAGMTSWSLWNASEHSVKNSKSDWKRNQVLHMVYANNVYEWCRVHSKALVRTLRFHTNNGLGIREGIAL